MSNRTLFLDEDLYQYMLSISLQESSIVSGLHNEAMQMPHANMQISPEQGQFIALLLKATQAKKVLEVGTFRGYSALVMALALPEDGYLITCDINKDTTEMGQRYWEKAGVSNKINLRLAPAIETLDSLIGAGEVNTFDFIFIDADKENYILYYEKSLQLLRSGGLIAVDNTFMGRRVLQPSPNDIPGKVIHEFNERLSQDDRIMLSVLPIGDGLTLALKL